MAYIEPILATYEGYMAMDGHIANIDAFTTIVK